MSTEGRYVSVVVPRLNVDVVDELPPDAGEEDPQAASSALADEAESPSTAARLRNCRRSTRLSRSSSTRSAASLPPTANAWA